MPPVIALILCICLVIVLLFIERRQNPDAPLALWIPTIWMLICGSRPVGYWFEGGLGISLEEGSPYDRALLSSLIILSIIIVMRRKIEWGKIFKKNLGLIFLFLFLGISVFWSDYEFVSLKRWFRLLGAIPVALVVLSDKNPLAAMESVIRRCAYILIPFSLMLIKYYPKIGVLFGRWSGKTMWVGVTLTKNSLGQLCAFSAFYFIWSYIKNIRIKNLIKYTKIADGLVLLFAVFMLAGIGGAFSATSSAVLAIGIFSILILKYIKRVRSTVAVILVLGAALSWVLMLYSEALMPVITSLLHRDETFTGRTDMWQLGLEIARKHPMFGAGFGGYWVSGNEISDAFSGTLTAHNGLLDVYIETGIVGVIILLVFLWEFYRKCSMKLTKNTEWGIMAVSFLVMLILFNFTESIFLKSSSYIWNITIFLTFLFSKNENKNSTAEAGIDQK